MEQYAHDVACVRDNGNYMCLCHDVQQQCHVSGNYSRRSQCHRRNTRFHFRFGEEWVIRTQSDRVNQYVGTDTMCNYHADKIAESKNGKGGVRVEKIISEWVRCPICGNKTRLQIRADTELKNFPESISSILPEVQTGKFD